ncbi:MAG: DNA polymerase III subunit delta [bacterium]|nr:DNA polymerase III subunit delta [bacterium]
MLYLFYGSDAFRIREAAAAEVSEAKKRLALPAEQPIMRVTPDDENPDRVFSYLAASSLFDPQKLAVIECLSEHTETFRRDLAAYMASPGAAKDQGSICIVTAPETSPSKTRTGKAARGRAASATRPKKNATESPITELARYAAKAEQLNTLTPEAMTRWIIERAKVRGLAIAPDVARIVQEMHGDNTASIATEIEKAALYLGASQTDPQSLQKSYLDAFGRQRITQDAFKLVDAIGRRDRAEALRILLRIGQTGTDPLQTLGLLAYAFRAMISVKDASSRPIRPEDIPAVTGFADWQVRQYRMASQTFSLDDLKKIYERLLGMDYRIKTGEGDSKMLLERFLLSI